MTTSAPLLGVIGGALIGLAAVMLMLSLGRVAGICGIVVNAMTDADVMGRSWRLAFVLGMPLGALLVTALGLKDWSGIAFLAAMPTTIIAGFTVGLGATVGSGCTSGHVICGLARFSRRSLVSTLTFIAAGAVTVFVLRH